jgi:hypothetical protein
MASSSGDNVVPLHASSCSEYRHAPAAGADLSNPLTGINAIRWLSREIANAVTDREFRFVVWVIDHTLGWGRETYTATYREMEHGNPVSKGVGKSRTVLAEIVAALAARGLLICEQAGTHGLTLSINYSWKPEGEAMLPTPKRLAGTTRSVANTEEGFETRPETRMPPVRKPGCPPSGNPDPFIEQSSEQPVENNPPPTVRWRSRPGTVSPQSKVSVPEPKRLRSPAPTLASTVVSLPARPREAVSSGSEDLFGAPMPREAKAPVSAAQVAVRATEARRAALRSMLRPGPLMQTWRIAFEEAYAEIPGAVFPPPTQLDLGKVKSALIAKWTGKTEELHDFIDFTVRNWHLLMDTAFSWMTKDPPPAYPSLRFFLAFRQRFQDQWSGRTTEKWINNLPMGEQRRFLELTMKQGMSSELALAKIGEERATIKLREEMEKREAEANRKMAVGLLAKKQADTRPVYTEDNPHPRSAVALGIAPSEQKVADHNFFEDPNLQPVAIDPGKWRDEP